MSLNVFPACFLIAASPAYWHTGAARRNAMLEVQLLGRFEVYMDGTPVALPSRTAQSLLAYLTLTSGTLHRRERLAALLWPDAEDDNARSYLRHALWRIRKAIEVGLPDNQQYLLVDELTLGFNPRSAYTLDVAALEQVAAQRTAEVDQLATACGLYRGELLPGFNDEWVVRERDRVEAVFERQMDRLVERLVFDRRWADVLEWSERWIALGHAPEPAFRALMLAHAQRGDRAQVAVVYRRCREGLFEQFGAQPSDETRDLFERLSRGERVPIGTQDDRTGTRPDDAAGEPPAPGEPPFQGLQFFDESDADRFFGRERLVARLTERLQVERFLALVGASGSGKSSVVRAGLVPALRGTSSRSDGVQQTDSTEVCIVRVLTPTGRPLESLAAGLSTVAGPAAQGSDLALALAHDPRTLRACIRRMLPRAQQLLLVVDQFEELFTLCRDPFEREAFVDNLLALVNDADGPTSVVIALRADFYAHCADYADLRAAIAGHQEYLGPMSAEELRRGIEAPAHHGGWKFDAGLVDVVLRDAGEEPGALPLVSHALLETWRRRRGRCLTIRGYNEAGGVRGAVAKTAERTYQQLSTEHQTIARRVFLRLTELGEGTQDTRRRAAIDELVTRDEPADAVQRVLRILADARLITLGAGTAEVAHEALIREWPTLRAWLNEDRAGLRLHRRLAESTQEWVQHDKDADLLYRGARLLEAQEWAQNHSGELHAQELQFLDAAVQLAEREANEREARRRRDLDSAQQLARAQQARADEQRQTAQRLRRRAGALAAAVVVSVILAGTAVVFGDQAQQGALAAKAAARVASSRELAAASQASLDSDPERSILLALQAVEITRSVDSTWTLEAESALHHAVLASRARLTLTTRPGSTAALAFASDGARLAAATQAGVATVWDATTGANVQTVQQPLGPSAITFGNDGAAVGAGTDGGTVHVWGGATDSERLVLGASAGQVRLVAFSPDGTRLATATSDGTVSWWDSASGQLLGTAYGSDLRDVQFSSTGDRALVVERGGTISVWDTTNARLLPLLTLHVDGEGLSAAFSPDARQIAAVDRTDVRIWDLASGREVQRITANASTLTRVAFSPDGGRVALGGLDGRVTVWAVGSGQHLLDLAGHTASITAVAFTPDGRQLASLAEDGIVKLWDVGPAHELLAVPGDYADWAGPAALRSIPLATGHLVYDPTGHRLAVGAQNGAVQLWDVESGRRLLTVGERQSAEWMVQGLTFSPDGAVLATSGDYGSINLWNTTSGGKLGSVSTNQGAVFDIAFSPNGAVLASAGADGTTVLWDVHTGDRRPVVLSGHADAISRLAFSPDGRKLAASSIDGTARLWDTTSGAPLLTVGSARNQGPSVPVGFQPFTALVQFETQHDALWSVAFSPDGARLVTAGGTGDQTATIWDASTGQEVQALRGHTATVVQAAFTPDGRRVATASRDGLVKIWDALTGRELLSLYGDGAGLGGLAVSPDGSHLAVGGDNGLRVYALQMDDLLALARTRLTRTWTSEECQTFLHLDVCPSPLRTTSTRLD